MQISVQWLSEWVRLNGSDASLDEAGIASIAHQLTMAGLEIEANERAAPVSTGIVVGHVLSAERHPDAEKLSLCKVSDGREEFQIVCGASNVRAGIKVPFAQVGAKLPGGMEIKKAKLRGVDSFGMLCSAKELGLAEESSGLLELPESFEVGADFTQALQLDDRVLAVNLTPNRGDCMSVVGIAREVAAMRGVPLCSPNTSPVVATSKDSFPVQIVAKQACTKFASRVVRGVTPNATSPLWLKERLRRAGVRSINAVVDVTNYVMLESGQPMHAYDLATLTAGLSVRLANGGEKLTLLDGREIELSADVLVIADQEKALGLAGVMGGQASSISNSTTDLLLEVAHFVPDAIIGRGRRYGLVTDAMQRFERGVDSALPEQVIERATQLILELAGGSAGPASVVTTPSATVPAIRLRLARVAKLLGVAVDGETVTKFLVSLGMKVDKSDASLTVTPPSWRFDVRIEEDLIEEVARLYGYDKLPVTDASIAQQLGQSNESLTPSTRVADALADRGYQEAVTYSFIAPEWQQIFCPGRASLTLANPISVDLSVMRQSLWPGLALAARENVRRQQSRVRLFEVGRKFVDQEELEVVAGIVVGTVLAEQWDSPQRATDFFDVKADVEALLQLTGCAEQFEFVASQDQPALHPGQAAKIARGGKIVGWLGALHPAIAAKLEVTYPAFVFELEMQSAFAARIPVYREISQFPAIRRDLAVIVDEAVDSQRLIQACRAAGGPLLRELLVLSVYRGEQIGKGKKSMALGLNLQDTSRTLTDADAEALMGRVMQQLREQFAAVIRDK